MDDYIEFSVLDFSILDFDSLRNTYGSPIPAPSTLNTPSTRTEVKEEAVPVKEVAVVAAEEAVKEVEVVEVVEEAEEIPCLHLHHHLHRVQVLHAEDEGKEDTS